MRFFAFFILLVLLFGCTGSDAKTEQGTESKVDAPKPETENGKQIDEVNKMKLTSPAFKHGENIPRKYTCDDQDVSPSLQITDVPANAKSIALIVDDPDAPSKTWLHWTVWNIPPDTKEIPEGAKIGIEGVTDFGSVGYGGPCPPSGFHTYRFKLYALDTMLNLNKGATLSQLENAMEGHILAQTELNGEYKRG